MTPLPKKRKISSVASTSNHEEASSSCCSPPRWNHDVFLSFRGDDTRLNFTGHLYSALTQRGINAYLDDTDLQRGTFIESTLWKAIEESRFSIIVFSKNYASSSWCLDELVKIVQCKEEKGHTPLPVFYDVDPSEVSRRTGNYGIAFDEHELRERPEKVRSWKDSLATVANLAGWDVRSRNESEIIRLIAEDISSRKLICTISRTSKGLVGIERRIKQFNGFLDEASSDTHFIGIFGMGGLGKTTLAREVYDMIRWKFDGACFLANVRKREQVRLQEQLLSGTLMQKIILSDYYEGIIEIQNRLRYKKVLVILDDVDKEEQLKILAAEHGWFGPGSRIIITSRDKHVLTAHGITRIYAAEKLNDDEALILFSSKAFKQEQPVENYRELSKSVVSYAGGLPLALEVIGSFLHDRSIDEWDSAINRLKKNLDGDIFHVLKISFDGLHASEKNIFLDIACFFKGMKKDRVTRILDHCGFDPTIGIQVLIEKSLISVSQNELWMHDLLQRMGEEIVRRESQYPGGRSRLWEYKDVFHALMNTTGRVESINLDLPKTEPNLFERVFEWNMEGFLKLSELRLLKIRNVQLFQGPEYLSNELRFLEWHAFPSKSLPSSFQPRGLVELDMPHSSIKQLWDRSKSLPNLKIMNLSYSLNLTSTPDFTGTPNLERLILEGCGSLSEVHPSIRLHNKLEYVNLVDCKSLRSLPSDLKMESLKHLTLSGCSILDAFPKIAGNMDCLVKLHLDETAIEELPSSIRYFAGLVELSIKNCQSLVSLPGHVSGLSSLEKLDLFGCSRLQNLPEDLGKVECLKELDASGTALRELPESIFLLKNLEVLSFDGCRIIDLVCPFSRLCCLTALNLSDCNVRDGVLPENIGQLSTLRRVDLSRNNFHSLPRSINQLFRLEALNLEDCRMIQSLPDVPSTIQNVNLSGCTSLELIPDPVALNGNKRSEFKCLNCWKLYDDIGCDIMGLTMLEKYMEGSKDHDPLRYPKPGFSIAVPGRKIPEWFIHQKEGSSINIEMPPKLDSDHRGWKGIAACVAFSSAYGSPSSLENCGGHLYCDFKINGREDYPADMWINWSLIQVLLDHLWLFCLSFDHLTGWQHEHVSNIELSFRSCEGGPKVNSCGIRLVSSSSAFGYMSTQARFMSAPALASVSTSEVHGQKQQEKMVELMDKILSRSDLDSWLAFPTSSLWAFPISEGKTIVHFQATDTIHLKWNFRLSIRRKNVGYVIPVITGDWLKFVREKGLKVGDKIVLNMEEDVYGVSYAIRAERKIFKVWVNVA